MQKLNKYWHGLCKSCKYYRVEVEDGFDAGEIFPGLGYCHFDPPRVLMDPEGKPITVRPQVAAPDDCGAWVCSEDVKFELTLNPKEQKR